MYKFIISGAARAGKTTLAKRIQSEFKTNLIAGDAFMRAMEHSFPETGIVMVGDFEKNIDIHSKFATHLLNYYTYYGHGYVLDSVHVSPENSVKMRELNGFTPTIFLGYAYADPIKKLKDIRHYDSKGNSWTSERSDEDLLAFIERQIQHSIKLKDACAYHNIPYIDTSENFEDGLEVGYAELINQIERG
jgi:hypothetical protein